MQYTIIRHTNTESEVLKKRESKLNVLEYHVPRLKVKTNKKYFWQWHIINKSENINLFEAGLGSIQY